jgi:hypothetical protein
MAIPDDMFKTMDDDSALLKPLELPVPADDEPSPQPATTTPDSNVAAIAMFFIEWFISHPSH